LPFNLGYIASARGCEICLERYSLERNADYHTRIALVSQQISHNSERIATFVRDLQTYSNSKLLFPAELELFLREVNARRMGQPLMDAAFHAKFVVKTQEVMKRIGPDADGFDKLAAEFQASVEQATSLLKTIAKEFDEEDKKKFAQTFFPMDSESFANLMKLFSDLAWVKNWENDGKQIPIEK
jgi:hypothetical protein